MLRLSCADAKENYCKEEVHSTGKKETRWRRGCKLCSLHCNSESLNVIRNFVWHKALNSTRSDYLLWLYRFFVLPFSVIYLSNNLATEPSAPVLYSFGRNEKKTPGQREWWWWWRLDCVYLLRGFCPEANVLRWSGPFTIPLHFIQIINRD